MISHTLGLRFSTFDGPRPTKSPNSGGPLSSNFSLSHHTPVRLHRPDDGPRHKKILPD